MTAVGRRFGEVPGIWGGVGATMGELGGAERRKTRGVVLLEDDDNEWMARDDDGDEDGADI